MMTRLGLQYNANGEKRQVLTAFANIAANTTDGSLIAAVTGKTIVVLGVFAHLAGATNTNVTLNSKGSGAGTAISSTKQIVANGGWVQSRGCDTDYLYKTSRGQGLTLTTGAGSTVGIDVSYIIDD